MLPHTGFSEEALQAAREFSNSATKATSRSRPESRKANRRGPIKAPSQARGRGGSLLNSQERIASASRPSQPYLAPGNVSQNNGRSSSLQSSIRYDATERYSGRGEFGNYRVLSTQHVKSPTSQWSASGGDFGSEANSSIAPLASISSNTPHQSTVQTTSLTISLIGQSFGKRGLAGSRWADADGEKIGNTSFELNSNRLSSGLEDIPPCDRQRETALSQSSFMASKTSNQPVEVLDPFRQGSESSLRANTWSSGLDLASQGSQSDLLDQAGDVEATVAQESKVAEEDIEDLMDLDAEVRVRIPSEVLVYGLGHHRPVTVTPTGHFLDDPVVASCTKGVLQPDQSQLRSWKGLPGLKNSRWA